MFKGTVLLELQSYHCCNDLCRGPFTGLPSGHAVDGAQLACGSGGCS